jgi:5-methylcytosine-specific restriction protein A
MRRPKQFRPSGQPTRQEQVRRYDRERGSSTERGYNGRWRKARLTHLARSPLCIGCEAAGEIVAASVVDHVDPHHGESEKFWNTAMWQSSCPWHHDVVKQKLEVMFANGAIGLADLWLNSEVAVRMTRRLRAEEA